MTKKELEILGHIAEGIRSQNNLLIKVSNETNYEQIQAFHCNLYENNKIMAMLFLGFFPVKKRKIPKASLQVLDILHKNE